MRAIQIQLPGGLLSASVSVVSSAPGTFLKDTFTLQGAVLNQDITQNSSTNPARPRSAISIYATGQGALDTTVAKGVASPQDPLARSVVKPAVMLEGIAADLAYSGLAPGDVAGKCYSCG